MDYSSVPKHYACCFNRECRLAGECLRHLAALATPPEVITVTIINPARISSSGTDCPYFSSRVKQRYARGMSRLLDPLPYRDAQRVKQQMIDHFGRNRFYRLRSKECTFSPEQQEYVRQLFLQCGVTEPPLFDEYVEEYVW